MLPRSARQGESQGPQKGKNRQAAMSEDTAITRVTLCPTCGESVESGFDGGNDMPYEYRFRVRYLPPLELLRCDYYEMPPQWLKESFDGCDA